MRRFLYYVATVPFEAARRVERCRSDNRLQRLHGHSFIAHVRALLPEGWATFPGSETEQLRLTVSNCVSSLNYDLLNKHIEYPTDENIARWIKEHLGVSGRQIVGIQSTRNKGANLDQNNHVHIWNRFRFEAAHRLPNVPEGHKCGRMHGHGFEIILHAVQDPSPEGKILDAEQLEAHWAPLHKELHLTCMNDIPGLENPTSEILANWLWNRIKPNLPQLSYITVRETTTAGCHYDGTLYRIWKEFRLESALRLVRAPEGDQRRRLHGHSYLVRLHLTSPLDAIMGWTIDYGDVKELFKPVYQQLDHHCLNDLEGLADADMASMLSWLRNTMNERIPQIDRIDLYETAGCGAILVWGEQASVLPV